MPSSLFYVPTQIVHGENALASLPENLKRLGIRRPLLVTDDGIVKAGLADMVLKVIGSSVPIFSDVPPDSSIQTIVELLRYADEVGADGFIAVGGGSVMDTAKGVNLVAAVGPDLADTAGARRSVQSRPMVAIPTTAGTGSEVSPYSVILDEEAGVKYPLSDPRLLPAMAVLAPELTLGLPPKLTAATGMDALTHAVEAHVSTGHNPCSDLFSLAAAAAIVRALPQVMAEPKNLAARSAMLTASCQAGIAFSSAGLGATHAIAHALGGLFHVPHGVANACILPYVMEYNVPYATERLASIARAIGAAEPGGHDGETARKGIAAIRKLAKDLGLPGQIRDLGVKREDLPKIAALAARDATLPTNPRRATEADILALLERAY